MRRFAFGALGLVLAVALAVVWIATRDDDSAERGRSGAGAQPRQRPQSVYRRGDARPAVPGDDYEVLQQVPGHVAHQSVLLLPDGTLVLRNDYRYGEGGLPLPDLVSVWDPATGEKTNLPARWPHHISTVTASGTHDLWVSFAGPGPGHQLHSVVHYDLRTGRDEVITVPDLAQARNDHVLGTPFGAADGRIYLLTGTEPCLLSRPRCHNVRDSELWSFAPDAPEQVRREAEDVGTFAVSPTLLIWSDPQEGLEDEELVLHVRRRGSGRVWTTTVHGCSPRWTYLQASEKYLLLCGRVYDARARRLARLDLYSHDLSGLGGDWIAWGWTVLHPASGRFLQISEGRIWHQRTVAMSGDLILFPTNGQPPNTRNGTWTLARLPG